MKGCDECEWTHEGDMRRGTRRADEVGDEVLTGIDSGSPIPPYASTQPDSSPYNAAI
jgi:hypothetical protein